MPISAAYTWEQTRENVMIHVALKGTAKTSVDIYISDLFLKVNFSPYLLAIDLHDKINYEKCVARFDQRDGQLHLTLPKETPQEWKDLILGLYYERTHIGNSDISKDRFILDRIPDERRIKKTWQPRKEEGNVYPEVFSLEEVPLQEGNWLVIARTNRKLLDTIPALKSMGIYYEYKQRKSFSKKLYKAITNWTRWTKGETLTPPEVRDIFEYTTDKFHIDEHKTYKMSDFKLIGTARWFESFQIDLDDSLYIRKMLERGELLSREARVKLSTIHTAKGGEADNVLLILDSSKRTLESLQRSFEKQDEEHRVWYVGVTRAKQNLYLMAAKNKERSYDIESLQ